MDRRSFLKASGWAAVGTPLLIWTGFPEAAPVETFTAVPVPSGPATLPAYWDEFLRTELRKLGHPTFKSNITLPRGSGAKIKISRSLRPGEVECELKRYAAAYSVDDRLLLGSRFPKQSVVEMAVRDIARDLSFSMKRDRIEWIPSESSVIIKALGSAGTIDPANCLATIGAKVFGFRWPF